VAQVVVRGEQLEDDYGTRELVVERVYEYVRPNVNGGRPVQRRDVLKPRRLRIDGTGERWSAAWQWLFDLTLEMARSGAQRTVMVLGERSGLLDEERAGVEVLVWSVAGELGLRVEG
jgi:hypothetical protein